MGFETWDIGWRSYRIDSMVYSLVLIRLFPRRLSSVVEQHFRKVEVPGSNPGGGSISNSIALQVFSVRIIFACSTFLQITLWWMRHDYISLNPLPLLFALGILLCNAGLSIFLLRKDTISSLILAVGTLYAQILVLVLMIASKSNF